VAWADLPDREEAGSPNVVGEVALAAAIKVLKRIGLERVAAHESELAHYAVARLAGVPGVRLRGPAEHEAPGIVGRKVGVIPFTVDGIDHGLVATVLGYEHGVRHGCFCAQPYVHHVLGVGDIDSTRWLDRARVDEHRGAPGMVRISLGAYNDMADIDRAVRALEWLVSGEVQGRYRADPDGSFVPDGYIEPLLFDLGLPGLVG
jgi:cysteine desulfurase / selenocysteine lyase